jgi:hypothetical protein
VSGWGGMAQQVAWQVSAAWDDTTVMRWHMAWTLLVLCVSV